MGSCKHWPYQELLPTADLLAHLLMENKCVTGVAVTGSLARFEKAIHDIDLVVLHDGSLLNGSYCIPFSVDLNTGSGTFGHWKRIESVLDAKCAIRLWQANREVPVQFFFVPENILWDCSVLQGMRSRTDEEADFFRTVFCDIPLILLNKENCRGGMKNFSYRLEPRLLYGISQTIIEGCGSRVGVDIQHRCGNPACQPDQPWSEKRKRVVARKGHDHNATVGVLASD